MQRLKEHRDWLLIPVLIASPLFFIGGPDWLSAPVIREAWEQGHWVFFACLMFWWQGRWPLRAPHQWLALTLVVVVLSALIEGLQTLVDRQASWLDILLNVVGTWIGLFWGQPATRWVWSGRVIATVLVLWQLQSVLVLGMAEYRQYRQFPVLSDFESRWDVPFWEGNVQRVRQPVAQGEYSLAVRLISTDKNPYAGTHLSRLVDDWRGYQALSLSIFNPGDDSLRMTLRINDATHDRNEGLFSDRYNGRLEVASGWNHYRIPLEDIATAPETRRMNLARMIRLLIFTSGVTEPRWIYLDNLRLEPTE
ncbi:hypothetical protein EDC38_2666 [Marinimicrobium koreense]|uniref:VanZ like protein n=1 Tax=Marinimicrobium koreense TaxID=306545 RepID=A0A3N1NVD0_9GAMM|nr:succinyl-CoA synthetase subunit beta [Marinimicrobium koreense]ROQ18440.1 hypothetical protein EDC38_2666 [Marinimicrobium koreense]